MLPAASFIIKNNPHHPAAQTVDIDHSYLDDEATLFGATIANIGVPEKFQPILNEFYDEIFRLKYKVDELRTMQRQFNEWTAAGVNVYQTILDNMEELPETKVLNSLETRFNGIVSEFSQKLKKTINTVTQNMVNINSERSHDRSYDIRDTIIRVIGELGELSYRIEQHLLAYRDLYDSVKKSVTTNNN